MSNDPSGERLRFLLEDRMNDEPRAPSTIETIERCERDYRKRNRLLVGASAFVVAAAVAVPLAVLGLTSGPTAAPAAEDKHRDAVPPVVKRCNHGNQPRSTTTEFNASGVPTVVASARRAQTSTVILESADGNLWAHCFINHDPGAEFPAGMTAYSMTAAQNDIRYSSGLACEDVDAVDPEPCETFVVRYVDRLPDTVAAVRFDTADGEQTDVATSDGFVLFTYQGTVPTDYSKVEASPQNWLPMITYLDKNGAAIAAQRMGTSDPSAQRVGDLPLLSAFPAYHAEIGLS